MWNLLNKIFNFFNFFLLHMSSLFLNLLYFSLSHRKYHLLTFFQQSLLLSIIVQLSTVQFELYIYYTRLPILWMIHPCFLVVLVQSWYGLKKKKHFFPVPLSSMKNFLLCHKLHSHKIGLNYQACRENPNPILNIPWCNKLICMKTEQCVQSEHLIGIS